MSLLKQLRSNFASRGFDIVHPFLTSWIDPQIGGNITRLTNHKVGLIIGNTKNIWTPFISSLAQNSSPHPLTSESPLDDFIEQEINDISTQLTNDLSVPVEDIFFTHDTSPERLISFQKLGHSTNLAHYSPELGLCLHAKFGAWFAFRAAIMLGESTSPNSTELSIEHELALELSEASPTSSTPLPFPCTPETQAAAAEQMQRLMSGVDTDWLRLRDTVSIGSEWRYDATQLNYHNSMLFERRNLLKTEVEKEKKHRLSLLPDSASEMNSDGGMDWGLSSDGSRANILASNLFTANPNITQPIFPEKEWRDLAAPVDVPTSSFDVRVKKLKWVATKRGWTEAGEFLISWVENGGLSRIEGEQQLEEMERLLKCDDMFLMQLIWGSAEIPDELNNGALTALRQFSNKNQYLSQR